MKKFLVVISQCLYTLDLKRTEKNEHMRTQSVYKWMRSLGQNRVKLIFLVLCYFLYKQKFKWFLRLETIST